MPKLSNTLIVITLFVGIFTSSAFSLDIKARHTPEDSKTTLAHDFDVSLKINLDANRFNGIYNDILQDDFSYDSQVRRTRLTVKIPVIENWSSKLQIAINEDDDNYEIKDLYLRYRGFETADLKIGKFKQ